MSNDVWFVTGTDTGVGKTVATAAVVLALRGAGRSAYVIKPAQTGVTADEVGDLDEVRRLVGDVPGHEGIRLLHPLAPDAAARVEGVALPGVFEQAGAVLGASVGHDVVVEGAGGLLVRLGDGWDVLDLADEVRAGGARVRFVIVARAGLGTLNHSALTVQAIQRREHEVAGLVIGSWPEAPDLASEQNLIDLPTLTGVPVLGRIAEGAGAAGPEAFAAFAAGIAQPL